MHLGLEATAARLPEVGTPAQHAFLLLEVEGRVRPPRAAGADAHVSSDLPDPPADPALANPMGPRAPLCMALAIDASSSMRGPRFALALQAARDLLDSLTPNDRVAVVTFDRSARVVLGPVALDPEGRANARQVLDRLATGVGTNIAAGWREGAECISRLVMPGAARRILVLTDGLPSQGEREPEALRKMVADGRGRGIETSVIGIGDAIDEKLCALLGQAGEGRFHYLRDEGMLGDAVANEIEGARRLAATDVSLVLALSSRVARAEVLHRFPCQPDGRTLEVRVGAVGFALPRRVLVQVEVTDPAQDAILGVAMARGRATVQRKHEPTAGGYALGARSLADEPDRPLFEREREAVSDRLSLSLPAGAGDPEARRRVAFAVLELRTLAEIRSAWDGFDARDVGAAARRLGRARELRRVLTAAGLVSAEHLAALPDVDAIEAAMLGPAAEMREARRTFTSWQHNTQISQILPQGGGRKPPPKE